MTRKESPIEQLVIELTLDEKGVSQSDRMDNAQLIANLSDRIYKEVKTRLKSGRISKEDLALMGPTYLTILKNGERRDGLNKSKGDNDNGKEESNDEKSSNKESAKTKSKSK